MKRLHCAVYTRKSTEEGLEQEFNSLDAQREACEAYIKSQKSEGWTCLPGAYDDGGFSGGSMERPALRQLLGDIAAGKIDIVVVYKFDRLTRSLADFARIVEAFDQHDVSFVSVTQAFNTTTSMGRLTLNVLLSFAQFEREVTGERIRDKIVASKAKGMWMGGTVPLGYDAKDRTLVVNEAEAETVRHIFGRYLELGSVHALKVELDAQGIVSKRRVTAAGRVHGGVSFGRGALFHLLRNRTYLGEIVHKGTTHPGFHDPILTSELFERVQKKLESNTRRRSVRRSEASPLAGLIRNAGGELMTPTHTQGRNGHRYRYYVASDLQRGSPAREPGRGDVRRIPAPIIEDLVIERVRGLAARPNLQWDGAREMIDLIELHHEAVVMTLRLPEHCGWEDRVAADDKAAPKDDGTTVLTVPGRLRLRGGEKYLVSPDGRDPIRRPRPDKSLIAGLKRAHAELRKHGIDLHDDGDNLADARSVASPYLRRLTMLAFLAPDIQQSILDGRQPPGLKLQTLLSTEIPLSWREQRVTLGYVERL